MAINTPILGNRLRQAREECGLSVEDVCALIQEYMDIDFMPDRLREIEAGERVKPAELHHLNTLYRAHPGRRHITGGGRRVF